jgi:signal transduction histidine kinase
MLAEGASLPLVLATLVQAVEARFPPLVGAIHLARDEAGLPPPIAPSAPDPAALGTILREHARASITGSDERDLGSLVLYTREPREPQGGASAALAEAAARSTPDEEATLERAAHLARIAIERRELEEQLRALSAHVESVREDERTGIAREIHDECGQVLTALKMDIAWILRRTVSESVTVTREALVDKLKAMSKMTDDAIHQVRRISADLRPGVLDDLGLVAAIEWQAQDFETRNGTACEFTSNVSDAAIPGPVATAVFRIFQESLTNITRHAAASQVEVRLEVADGGLRLTVQDDGKGISTDAARNPRSLGLVGMRERAQRLGGSLTVTPIAPHGTRVSVRVPSAPGEKR